MRKTTKRVLAVGAAAVIAAGAGTFAWASFTGSSTGSITSTQSHSIVGSQITVGANSGPNFHPGSTQTVTLNVGNANQFPVKVNSITGQSVEINDGQGLCQEGAVKILTNPGPNPALGGTIGANGSYPYTVTVKMEEWAGNGCAGRLFTINTTAALESVPS